MEYQLPRLNQRSLFDQTVNFYGLYFILFGSDELFFVYSFQNLHIMFSTLSAHHNIFFPQLSFLSFHFFPLFYRFFKFLSYNLFFRRIFYFIVPALIASLQLFLNMNNYFTKSSQIVLYCELDHLENFELVSILMSKKRVIASKLLKWLFLQKIVLKNHNWPSGSLLPWLGVENGASLMLFEILKFIDCKI